MGTLSAVPTMTLLVFIHGVLYVYRTGNAAELPATT